MSVFLKGLSDNNMEIMQTVTKIIAHAVRNEMEDFHVKYLSDDQMKELNPLIRTAIYNAMFALANCDIDPSSKSFIGWHLKSIPEYWEDSQLSPMLHESLIALSERQIDFTSQFLREQYKIGNIYFVPNKKCIQLRGSFEFIGVPYDDGKKLKAKITYQLGREGYIYDHYKEGYIKQHL